MCATFFHCRASKDKIIKRYMNMIIYNRIAVIAILLLSLLTTSCNTDYTRNHADEIRESITDVVNGLRDGFYDSTVVVTINDTLASAADAEMVASTISMTTADSGRRGGGVTTINIVLPDSNYGPDIDNDRPSFRTPCGNCRHCLDFRCSGTCGIPDMLLHISYKASTLSGGRSDCGVRERYTGGNVPADRFSGQME